MSEHTPTPAPSRAVIAKMRGWQTLRDGVIAGVIAVLLLNVLPLIVSAVQQADGFQGLAASLPGLAWASFQTAVVAGGTAVIAWAQRAHRDGAGIQQ